jgi:sodium/proline symporter
MSGKFLSEIVFAAGLIATFTASILARRRPIVGERDGLAGYNLTRWLLGLSAGTTANSGFIVTAAVGLGYAHGLKWVLLPLSWLIGDGVFWYFFPARINEFGRRAHITTLSELLRYNLFGFTASAISVLSALIIIVCLTGYISAQWLAGQKFLAGAFGLPDAVALAIFALLIISYSTIGGFIGSVYTDAVQALIRVAGTIVALVAVTWFATTSKEQFSQNLLEAGGDFLNPFPGGTLPIVCGFVFGFAAAAIGFGLGQPQIVTRYLAGRSPRETQSAWWIYIGFVQFTWIAMTVFGVILRGVMPEIADPEAALSIFFQKNIGAIATGLIAADVFATIASTSNGLLIAMAQTTNHDLLPLLTTRAKRLSLSISTMVIGGLTLALSIFIHGTVVTLALSSVSLMGAGIASAVMIKILGWRHTGPSLLIAILAGLTSATVWKWTGFDALFNEAGVGIATGLALNWLTLRLTEPNLAMAPSDRRISAGNTNSYEEANKDSR